MRIVPLLLATLALLPLRAQDAAALAEREAKLTARAILGLHTAADALQTQKQHLRALHLRREVMGDYDENDAKARQKCGFAKVGDAWRRDPNLLVLDKNMPGDGKALRKIDQEFEVLGRELGAEHKALAEAWATAKDDARAMKHWQRALRWLPGDKAAVAAMALASFEGFRGTPDELAMLRRARAIRGAVEWLHRAPFHAEVMKGEQHPLLTAANIDHLGVRSEHFEVWGAMPEALLLKLAQYAERSLLLCHTMFGTANGEAFVPVRLRNMVFVPSVEQYHRILDTSASQFDAGRLQFLKEIDQAFVDSNGKSVRVYKIVNGEDVALDQCVRGVVQDASGIQTDGLWEGIGHAVCGFFFNRTLTFLLEQQTQQTSASAAPKPLLPDLETWMKIAEESAWSRSDTRTSELVLLSAAKFTNEQRVKAWAMCDYLLRWRPELVLRLDKSQTPAIRTPPDVEKEFLKLTKVELPLVDSQWRDYWSKQAPLRAAMTKDPVAAEKAPERAARVRARTLVDAVNEARTAAMRGPVGFFVGDSADVAAAITYTDQLGKAEALQKKKKPPEVVPLPPVPAAFGVSVLWSRRATPAEAVQEWLQQPALRDVLLHPGRNLCGSGVSSTTWVLDIALPAMPTLAGSPQVWPRDGQGGVVGSVRVSDLGPRAAAALVAAGKKPTDLVGMPLSVHFSRSMPAAILQQVECRAFCGNLAMEGVTVLYEGEPGQADTAPGLVVFVPLQPLSAGPCDVQWAVPATQPGKSESLPRVRFTVR